MPTIRRWLRWRSAAAAFRGSVSLRPRAMTSAWSSAPASSGLLKVRAVVLIGRDAPLIERALQNVVPVVRAASMDDAVQRAHELAQPGDTVLLSPACASFDMFKGYDQRGDVYTAAVQRLPQ